ncbi:hypothetical protein AYK20_06540 [Thermoplasmatales archaeon SG8-52-1]|jgi:hypothetical protein|nr:MAG: hypothetical protein AYK20_06540 [Thermoplasmatales archaeon SG8-52-1]
MIEVMENATIVYTDGVKERFEAVYLTDKRVITGRIYNSNGNAEFKEYGFISRSNVKHIYNGSKRKVRNLRS